MSWSCGRSRKLKNSIYENLDKYIKTNENIEFPKDTNIKICLDIGFGTGDSILKTLEEKSFVIGCEIFKPAILQTLSKIDDKSRVTMHMSFIGDLIKKIPSASIDEVKILFPDPWPKYKHRMRRCYNLMHFDLQVARILKNSGQFIFASDIFNMFDGINKVFKNDYFTTYQNQYNSYENCPYKTSYAKKGFTAGRKVYELIAKK